LDGIGFNQYKEMFAENEIGLEELCDLDENDLIEMGMTSKENRMKLLEAIAMAKISTQVRCLDVVANDVDAPTAQPANHFCHIRI
jgi:hypothetical protein